MSAWVESLLYSSALVAGLIGAGIAAAWWQPGARVRSYIQHLAAGIVFAAIGVEVLPDVMHRRKPFAAAIGFAAGVLAMLAIRELSRRAESSRVNPGKSPLALLTAVSVDVFVDGLLVGVGFAEGQRQGILIVAALTGCAVSLGLATSTALLHAGNSQLAAAGYTALVGLLPAIGALAGALLATQLSGEWMEVVLSFTCAALLYLVVEELLFDAHESQQKPETSLTTATLFLGFLALLLVNMSI